MKTTNLSTMMVLTVLAFGLGTLPAALIAQEMERPMMGRGPRHTESDEHGPRGPMARLHAWIEELKENDPDEYERLMALREEDPQAFRQEIRKRLGERMKQHMRQHAGPEEQKCMELARRYHAADSAGEKAEIKEQLEDAVQAAFDARLEQQETMLEKMEERLDQLREHLATRKAHREKICDERVDELTANPAVRW